MKKDFFHEIFNLKAEYKEYKLLCRCKSKKYKVYTEWESHIRECLSKFKESQDLYNFKRYCMNHNRKLNKAPEMFGSYIILLVTLCINFLFNSIPPCIVFIIAVGIILYNIHLHKRVIPESYFFKDIIDIIEKMEHDNSQI